MAVVKNKKLIVDLLNKDMQDEHAAIIQYLYHAWTLDLPGISGPLESISREEMYHYQWLAQRVNELGGNPSIGRSPVHLEAPSFKELISLNTKIEDEAIAQYEQHISEIDDEPTKRLLQRILHDERIHREQFIDMAEKIAAMEKEMEADSDRSPEAEAKRQKLFDMLNSSVKEEYTAILQYLHQAYTAKDAKFGHYMEQNAVTEMKHMGWLAEEVADRGGKPVMERDKAQLAEDKEDMIRINIDNEVRAVKDYGERAEAVDDEEVKELFERLKYHEEVHRDDLAVFLEEAKEEALEPEVEKTATKKEPGFTVGSLLENQRRSDS